MMTHNDILKSWLRTLRYCIESYEDSCYEKPLKNNNMVNSDGCDEGAYVKIWECSDWESYEKPCEPLDENHKFLNSETTTDLDKHACKKKLCKKPIPTPRISKHSKPPEYKTITGNEFHKRSESTPIHENLPIKKMASLESLFQDAPLITFQTQENTDECSNNSSSKTTEVFHTGTRRIKSLPLLWNHTEKKTFDYEYSSLKFAKELELNSEFVEETLTDLSDSSEEKVSIIEEQPVEKLGENITFWILTIQTECSEELNDNMEKKELLEPINQDFKNSSENSADQPITCSHTRNVSDSEHLISQAETKYINGGKQHKERDDFEIQGIRMVEEVGVDKPIFTKRKEEYMVYANENFYRVNERTKKKEKLLNTNVLMKSIRYPKTKESKEVQLMDSRNNVYIFHFQEMSFSRRFMESDKFHNYTIDNKSNIKRSLLRFMGKRSSRELLEKKGIYKNEPIFGNTLREIYAKSGSRVPEFVKEVINLLEKPENIESLGMYRASGNLAIIQKIRCEVDNGKLGILAQYGKDPDVLAGSLKLFFRELKEPLVPFDICVELSEFTNSSVNKLSIREHQKIRSILINNLCTSNLETFVVLMRHLLEVIKLKEYNKMDAYNLAICWGPTMIFTMQEDKRTLETAENIVVQSQAATRLISFFLIYYELYPSELDELGKQR